jgi:hypothetical protein
MRAVSSCVHRKSRHASKMAPEVLVAATRPVGLYRRARGKRPHYRQHSRTRSVLLMRTAGLGAHGCSRAGRCVWSGWSSHAVARTEEGVAAGAVSEKAAAWAEAVAGMQAAAREVARGREVG